jgi:hypothetical protein
LELRAGDHPAVRNAEAIAEFDRGSADDDLFALELFQGCGIAAQDIYI